MQATPLRSALTALQITLDLRRPTQQSPTWMQSFQCDLHAWSQRSHGGRVWAPNERKPDPSHKESSPHRHRDALCARKHKASWKVPTFNNHFQWENIGFHAIPSSPAWPSRSKLWWYGDWWWDMVMWSSGDVVMWWWWWFSKTSSTEFTSKFPLTRMKIGFRVCRKHQQCLRPAHLTLALRCASWGHTWHGLDSYLDVHPT